LIKQGDEIENSKPKMESNFAIVNSSLGLLLVNWPTSIMKFEND
jgi:hypothetical protein